MSKVVKPRIRLENETEKEYKNYLRNFYFELNMPNPDTRYDFAKANNLEDTEDIMDDSINGAYVNYLHKYYKDYYEALDQQVNLAFNMSSIYTSNDFEEEIIEEHDASKELKDKRDNYVDLDNDDDFEEDYKPSFFERLKNRIKERKSEKEKQRIDEYYDDLDSSFDERKKINIADKISNIISNCSITLGVIAMAGSVVLGFAGLLPPVFSAISFIGGSVAVAGSIFAKKLVDIDESIYDDFEEEEKLNEDSNIEDIESIKELSKTNEKDNTPFKFDLEEEPIVEDVKVEENDFKFDLEEEPIVEDVKVEENDFKFDLEREIEEQIQDYEETSLVIREKELPRVLKKFYK